MVDSSLDQKKLWGHVRIFLSKFLSLPNNDEAPLRGKMIWLTIRQQGL